MGTLSDPKLEKFSQALLVNIAQGIPRSNAAAAAAKTAGYSGSSMAANARKRAVLPQVKARMATNLPPPRSSKQKVKWWPPLMTRIGSWARLPVLRLGSKA